MLVAMALAPAQSSAATRTKLLARAQVLKIALRVAKADGEARPTRIELASGKLKAAVKVFDPRAHPTAAGLRALGGAKSAVDVVAMRGHFTSHGPHPHNKPEPKGRALELIMNARTGTVFGVSLGPKVPVALSRLGHVTRLR
ncbi:MAG TPA: hypothetical protein VGX51_04225 [Solirubrobacteraceae bacterium]|nr:hypothetical protein [Solirubrobacteraceae bacterium]